MIFTCTSFKGFWPVGSAAIVDADCPGYAAYKLNEALKKHGLKGDVGEADMMPFPDGPEERVRILCDGNY